ncbi:uncharacterized protein LOC114358896 [Ostrinia furnacalis]|uniref:uncharacterized protein LOC114358896 n=1 Tax=Ostrinia furnacalis TaxID=93504 RepID=UPI00103C8BAE|nr:uncharacterized protein LOC114358896 [Ostrinia furnacalis]
MYNKYLKAISFNCKSVTRSAEGIRALCQSADIIALQETWLLPHDIAYIAGIHPEFDCYSKSAVNTGDGLLRGRPYGGVAIMWRKSLFTSVSIVQCNSVRLAAIKTVVNDRTTLFISVYMPCDTWDNLIEFTSCLSEINALIECNNIDSVFILGDFNAHPSELFFNEMYNFCCDQLWDIVDYDYLRNCDTFTYVSDINSSHRWLDHCITTKSATNSDVNIKVLYDIFWSDHFPLEITIDMGKLSYCKKQESDFKSDKAVWGERNQSQINKYFELCSEKLRTIDFPEEFRSCANRHCSSLDHKLIIDKMYDNIVCTLRGAAIATYEQKKLRNKNVVGWNKYVKSFHSDARRCFQMWVLHGKPKIGYYYDNMKESRKLFKSKIKWCQDNEQKLKMQILATHIKTCFRQMLMGLPRYCSASAMFTEARIDSFPVVMRKRVASAWSRVRDSSNSLLAAIGTVAA